MAFVLAKLIGAGAEVGVSYYRDRKSEREEAEFMSGQYPQLYMQVFHEEPERIPGTRMDAMAYLDEFATTEVDREIRANSEPGRVNAVIDHAIKCYQLVQMMTQDAKITAAVRRKLGGLAFMKQQIAAAPQGQDFLQPQYRQPQAPAAQPYPQYQCQPQYPYPQQASGTVPICMTPLPDYRNETDD